MEHQSQTPGTFFGGKPVLHCHSPGANLVVSIAQYEQTNALHELSTTPQDQGRSDIRPNGASTEDDVVISGIDVWVTSRTLILFSPSLSRGFSVAYPTIALHAIGSYQSKPAVYMQLNLHDVEMTNSDDEIETLDLHVIPTEPDPSFTNGAPEASNPAMSLFHAMSACADLNPDPASPASDTEDTIPGAGGWITSDNMHEFIDEDGNFTSGGALGAGAGTIRFRDEELVGDLNENDEEEDTKWRRTE